MNLHFKAVIDRIKKKHPRFDTQYLFSDSFLNKYFPIDEFGYVILSEKLQKEFDRRVIVALEDAISVYKKKGTTWFIVLPFTYFFGSFLVEYLLDVSYIYEGEFMFFFAWFYWILFCIVFPIVFGIINKRYSKVLRDFINIDLQSITYKDSRTITNDINVAEPDYKKSLKELKILLDEELITQAEYDDRRKQILDDLLSINKDD